MNTRKKSLFFIFLTLPAIILACSLASQATESVEPLVRTVVVPATSQPIVLPEAVTNEEAVTIELYRLANPAVVKITTYSTRQSLLSQTGEGSGFFYDEDGHIVTNAHVIHAADQVEVTFWDGSIAEGEVIGEDLHSDLAVVKVAEVPVGVTPLPIGNIEEVNVGQTVFAIGNPFGLGGTLTRGIVSAIGRSIPALSSFTIPQAIQTDAPINPGNSGGPLLNLNGEVIGVNAQIETGGGSRVNSGIGFAIPSSIVSRVVPDLIADGKHPWAWLGVSGGTVYPALVEAMDLPTERGAYIVEVLPNTPAADAGMLGATRQVTLDGRVIPVGGDVIIAIDDLEVTTFEDILLYLTLNKRPGDEVILKIIRDGKTMELEVVLQERPETLQP